MVALGGAVGSEANLSLRQTNVLDREVQHYCTSVLERVSSAKPPLNCHSPPVRAPAAT